MKILYLFNKIKSGSSLEVLSGQESDNHFFGMYRLPHFDIQAEYLEIEQFLPNKLTAFIRKYLLNIYYIHLPLFLKFFKYDIVFTSTAFGSLLLKAILRLKRPKWIMFDFSISGLMKDPQSLRKRVFKFMVKYGADGIITISKKEEQIMKEMFPRLGEKVKFMFLGTDTDFYKPDEAVLEDGAILSVGRDPHRDYGLLIKVMKDLNIPISIMTKPQHLSAFLPLPQNVTLKNVSTKELIDEYRRAKIVILPLSTKSGLNDAVGCSTLVEAMSLGKAIIATETPTMKSYIQDGANGLLVPEGDEEALRCAITDLWNDQDKRRRLGVAARKFALDNCEAEKFADSLAKYFLKLKSYG